MSRSEAISNLPVRPRLLRLFAGRAAMELAAAVPLGSARSLEGFATFSSVARALGAAPGWGYCSTLCGRLIVRALCATSGRVKWHEVAGDAWATRAVHDALAEMRTAGLTSGAFAGKPVSRELEDLTALLTRYEHVLAAGHLVDDADRDRHAVAAVARGELPPDLAAVRGVVVEGGASLFGSRLDLLNAMAARGVRVQVRLPWDPDRPDAFAWPEASVHSLETRAHEMIEVDFDARIGQGALAELRAAQFTDTRIPGAPVTVRQLPRSPEHARHVAHQVGLWLRAGVPPQQIAVVATDVEHLGRLIAAELGAGGIAARLRVGVPLANTLPGRLLLSALRLPEGGYAREALIDLWIARGRFVPTPIGPWSAERVARELRRAGVRSARVGGIRAALMAYARRTRDDIRELREACGEAVVSAIEAVIGVVEALPQSGALVSYIDAVEALLAALALEPPDPAGDPHDPDGVAPGRREVWRAQAAVFQAIGEITDVLSSLRQAATTVPMAAVHGGVLPGALPGAAPADPEVWTREQLVDLVELAVSERRLPVKTLRAGAVGIMTPEELVETSFARVIFAGLDNGAFPRAPPPDPVLTDALRFEINRMVGPRLLQSGPMLGRGALRGDARDHWLWLEVLAACRDELVVTYSASAGEDEKGRSELVDELLRSVESLRVEIPPPSYAVATPLNARVLAQQWALAAVNPAAELAPRLSRARAAALQRALAVEAGAGAGAALPDAEAIARRAAQHEARQCGAWQALPRLQDDVTARLRQRLVGRVTSTSQLDTLAMCAFRYFAQVTLRLAAEEVPTLGLDAREHGSAAHAALYEVYGDLRERGGLRVACADVEAVLRRAREVVSARADNILAEVQVHPLLREAALEEAFTAVRMQLARDLKAPPDSEPVALEYAFGDRPDDDGAPLELVDPAGRGSVFVRGMIDRVDVGGQGLLTIDYKRTMPQREDGRHVQLPIYAAVALRDLAPHAREHRAVWALLGDGRRVMAADLPVDVAAFIAALPPLVWARIDRLLRGEVHPDPAPAQVCRACDFRALCRYQVQLEGEDDAADLRLTQVVASSQETPCRHN